MPTVVPVGGKAGGLGSAPVREGRLVPFLDPGGPGVGRQVEPLGVDATLPGRAFQHVEVLTQDAAGGRIRVLIRCWTASSGSACSA